MRQPLKVEPGFLDLALEEASRAQAHGDVPVGAIIVHNGQVIAHGMNRRELDQDPTAHAEIIAIRAASTALKTWRLEGCALYVTLEPCAMCLASAQAARVELVVYGATDPKAGALSLGYRLHEDERTNHRFAVTLSEDPRCSQILKDFFSKRRSEKKGSAS
ncbi:MAG: nucleoside deaminase [Bdellovibrionales bacterium]|nr:nucleoside deaminase [Bdellovibrionales bacterium]